MIKNEQNYPTKPTEKYVWAGELRHICTVGGFALLVLLILGILSVSFLVLPASAAVDNWEVDGAHGVLRVHGMLTESACRLDMDSVYQDINLGVIGSGELKRPGERGQPVQVEIRLEDCLLSSAGNRDERTGLMIWARNQPAVTVSFHAASDINNPKLARVTGVSGVGLRLEDPLGKDVRLGSRGEPLLLTPGNNSLTYFITPERTEAELTAGSYQSVIDFHLSYD